MAVGTAAVPVAVAAVGIVYMIVLPARPAAGLPRLQKIIQRVAGILMPVFRVEMPAGSPEVRITREIHSSLCSAERKQPVIRLILVQERMVLPARL